MMTNYEYYTTYSDEKVTADEVDSLFSKEYFEGENMYTDYEPFYENGIYY